jgi:hypothetical protein
MRDENTEEPLSIVQSFRRRFETLPCVVATIRAGARQLLVDCLGVDIFLPVVVSFTLLIILYHSGQVVSLLRSLSAAMSYTNHPKGSGYVPSVATVVAWWACGLSVLGGASLFLCKAAGTATGAGGAPRKGRRWAVIYLIAQPLLLAPIFLHPAVNPYAPWPILSLLGLCCLHAALMSAYSKQLLDGASAVAFAIMPVVVLAVVLHQFVILAVLIMAMMSLWLFLHPRLSQFSLSIRLGCMVGLFFLYACTLLASIQLARILRFVFVAGHFDSNAVLLSVWWLLPAAAATLLRPAPTERAACIAASAIALLCLGVVVVAGVWPAGVFLPITLCASAALVLAVARLGSGNSFTLWRKVLTLGVMGFVVVGLWRLDPVLQASQESPQRLMISSGRQSAFHEFYVQWLAARGESVTNHGPLIFVAAAGGGLRAAAHTALSLAAADDATGGEFGDRVLAISGVSGGALGVTAWLGMRSDGLTAKLAPVEGAAPVFGRTNALAEYFQGDFVSVVANRLIAHDFPLAALHPGKGGTSDRAKVLADAWELQWKELLEAHKVVNRNLFARSFASIAGDARLPLTVVNTTSAHDGLRAVYSSVAAAFPGARRLDPATIVASAVSDSARFAVVSPLGLACADEPIGTYYAQAQQRSCPKGYFPVTVADGGYTDNSGLASINELIDELRIEKDDLHNVYVVIVSSDGSAGLPRREGTRFSNGYLLGELLAPGYVMDAGRSGHTATFDQLVRGKLPSQHVYSWDLSWYYMQAAFRAPRQLSVFDIPWLDEMVADAQFEKNLILPPLGWTLDPFTFDGVRRSATSHVGMGPMADCRNFPGLELLCRDLLLSRSPK